MQTMPDIIWYLNQDKATKLLFAADKAFTGI